MWLLELCLAKGASAGAVDANGWTALHWAAANGSADAVRRLLEVLPPATLGALPPTSTEASKKKRQQQPQIPWKGSGMGAGARDVWGRVPLHWAACAGHHDAACGLVAAMQPANIDLHVKDAAGSTPTQLAAGQQHVQLVTLLLESAYSGAHIQEPACSAASPAVAPQPGNTVAAPLMPPPPGPPVGRGMTALHLAAQNGMESVSEPSLQPFDFDMSSAPLMA